MPRIRRQTPSFNSFVARAVQERRLKTGATISEVAEASQCSLSTITNVEDGVIAITAAHLHHIGLALQTSASEIIKAAEYYYDKWHADREARSEVSGAGANGEARAGSSPIEERE